MAEDRLTAICGQTVLTGIDFIEIVDPHVQTQLRVYFIVDPDTLGAPMVATAAIPAPFSPGRIKIESTTGGARVAVTAARWRRVPTSAGNRTVIEIDVAAPGDFSAYRLTIDDAPTNRVDRFFNGTVFSFKQGCPSVFDCRHEPKCPPEPAVDVPVDYLARDFESLRNALLDFSAQRYPLWRERIPADQAVMLMELAAGMGDELAYVQDRIAHEATLDTLEERRSLRRHAQLVDYTVDDGASATTWLDVQMKPGADAFVPAGAQTWATPEGEPAIPFEVGPQLPEQRSTNPYWLSSAWNSIEVHVPDSGAPCLGAGATELYLRGRHPLAGVLPPGADPAKYWLDRPMVIQTAPADPSLPSRRHLVRISAVEVTVDPLATGGPLLVTRIGWDADQATPFEICLEDATVHANIVPATAGETFTEQFAIGDRRNVPAALATAVSLAIEADGPLNELTSARPIVHLYSLRETELRGLGWISRSPEVELREILPDPGYWKWRRTLVGELDQDETFTLDDGTWKKIATFDRPDGRFEHRDRASADGMTIRFGDGDFGRAPAPGTYFEVRYRTDVGARANLPPDSIRTLVSPIAGGAPSPLVAIAASVTNPFAVTDGRDPQDLETVKQLAPEAYKALPRRAVRDEDYRELAERLPWVQRAGASARWTGSWLTESVAVDPRGTVELSPSNRALLEREMDCVRQAGRPIVVQDPIFLPVDLRVQVCIRPDAYAGQVLERIVDALTRRSRPGHAAAFFHPDHFTFGTPLYRSSLEAAVQAVPGVLGVEEVRIRVRGLFGWRVLTELVFQPGDDRILRIDNDPNHPEAGSLIATARSLAS